ncbi:beta1 proteasome1D, putative [Acanthamoeba castellanii str. Neff]|jgi:20S proteasome subunit beta 1|uniref:Proteasome subunit beta n=1 Tax=Acanthamoeba castellanii (strain ATCC 30010 / Neff) TaxID=1257118 RepID=L8HG01_ACACF|nr:beta1 proteasome1D, putative [Acanthamoeba castellanii str. Neff]ELR23376.1 beta1 proteasome1D, putative [Acanthamoeba castellanii str. Neff]
MDPSLQGADWNEEHKTGTSIMAVVYKDGVVVGADSRTTTGAYIANRTSDKLTPVHDKIYCCRSGSAADTQAIADYVKWFLNQHSVELGEEPEVGTAANLFKQLCYANKNFIMAAIIVGGYDKHNGGSVYSIPLGGSLIKEPWAIGGSGSSYIYGYCDANYKPGMTKDEALAFVQNALSLAMSRDGSSGGVIRTVTITADGVERKMLPGNKLPQFYED